MWLAGHSSASAPIEMVPEPHLVQEIHSNDLTDNNGTVLTG